MSVSQSPRVPLILVTGVGGGTQGSTGTAVALALVERGFRVRALVHSDRAENELLKQRGMDVIKGDLLDLASVRAALVGVERAYFTYPVASTPLQQGLLDATAIFAAAAKETAGLKMIVNLSQGSAGDPLAKSPRARQHWLSENVLDWAQVRAVHLRPVIFFENVRRQFADLIRDSGQLSMPLDPEGETPIPLIAAEDVARAAVSVLAGDYRVNDGDRLLILGEVLTPVQLASKISNVIGRTVTYECVTNDEWKRNVATVGGVDDKNPLAQAHLSALWATVLGQKGENVRFDGSHATKLKQMLGANHSPITFDEFVKQNAGIFGHPGPFNKEIHSGIEAHSEVLKQHS